MSARRVVCVVVAHPDDEALWFGGGLLHLQRARVPLVLVSMTNARNPVRAAEFRELCRRVDARAVMLDYADGGYERLPTFPAELTPALSTGGTRPSEILCVVTHSPLGNERAHPQHRQCWEAMRAWCEAEDVGLAFFSECALDELRAVGDERLLATGVARRRAAVNWRRVVRLGVHLLRRRPLRLEPFHRVRQEVQRIRSLFGDVRQMLVFDVDPVAKADLLRAYPSQPGLGEYAAFVNRREYVYVADREAADALERLFLPCPS